MKVAGGLYQPLGEELEWSPTRELAATNDELSMLHIPVLATAARITHRADLRNVARQLFRDVAFYRDISDGQAVDPTFRALINFRAFQFGGSSPKAYGHTGLTLSEYLPDLVGSLVLPRNSKNISNALLTEAATQTVQVGQTLRLTLNRQYENGYPLPLSAANLPANARFDATTGEFTFTPVAAQAGQVFQTLFTSGSASSLLTSKLDLIVLADTQAPQVRLLTPTNQQRLTIGKSTKVTWESDAPGAVTRYELRLSTDGGVTYPMVVAQLPSNVQAYDWNVPDSLATYRRAAVRLMVVAVDTQNRVSLDFTEQDLQFAGQLAVVSAANYLPTFAPGSLCSAFGTKLATATAPVSSSLFQNNGTTIDVQDSAGITHRIPLFFAASVSDGSYDQVNFYLPEEIALGDAVVTITAASGEVSQSTISIQQLAPAIFTTNQSGKGEAAVVSTSDGSKYNYGFAKQDATRDVFVSLFGTGWRFANQPAGAVINELAAINNPVVVEVNNQPVEVTFAGAQSEYLGLDQINFKLPRTLPPGSYSW
ncbi:MAG: hypothetical protein U0Y68_01880 [Blastocatellia bacterium]